MNDRIKIIIYHLALILYLLLGIASVIIGFVDKHDCEYNDINWFSVNKLLIYSGFGSCVFASYYLLASYITYRTNYRIPRMIELVMLWLHIIFIIVWYAMGGFLIINIDRACITKKSFHVIYALVVWSLVYVFIGFCQAFTNFRLITTYYGGNGLDGYNNMVYQPIA